ncbi:MAG: ATP-binding protein [Steroidobacteraceae bacterium]
MNNSIKPETNNSNVSLSFGNDLDAVQPVLEALPDAILIVRADGVIAALNTQAARLFGYDAEALQGERLEILLPLRFGKAHVQLREKYVEQPTMRPMGAAQDLVACRKDGSELYVDISLSPVTTPQGMLVIATIRDASRRKQVELDLRQMNDSLEDRVGQRTAELRTANQHLELFSYAVSHELRSPLQIIAGYGQLLLQNPAHGDRQHYLETILETTGRMNAIIDDLLKMGRIHHSEMTLAAVDMTQLARQVAAQLQETMQEPDVQVVIQPLPAVCADSGLMIEVLTNLLGNAVKFSRGRKQAVVEVSGWQEMGETHYQVRDNGAGFDMSAASKLFSPFHRLHPRKEFEGTGVGLAITRSIIERHGGRIWAVSAPGSGASFCFSIPDGAATDG